MVFGHRAEKRAAEAAALDADRRRFIMLMLRIVEGQISIDAPCQLKAKERTLMVLRNVGLFEPRSTGGHWAGRSQGLSIPVGEFRFRVGQSRGHYVHDPEVPTVIDRGDATVTDHRIIFQGVKQVREWRLDKLIGFAHDATHSATAIQVSNRQKVSGISCHGIDPTRVRLALEVATSLANGEQEATVQELRGMLPGIPEPSLSPDLVVVAATASPPQPAPSAPPVAGSPVAEWAPDPSRRHQYRYWDGKTWTSDVADNGTASKDPLTTDR